MINEMFRIVMLFAAEGSAIAALHLLGAVDGLGLSPTDAMAGTTRTEECIASLIRLGALAIAYWVTVGSALYLVSRLRAGSLTAPNWVALPVVRRLIDKALAVTVALSTLSAPLPATASGAAPAEEQTYVPRAAGFEPAPEITVDNQVVIPPGAELPWSPAAPTEINSREPLRPFPAGETYSVVEGDNLWSIADRILPSAEPSALIEYWIELIALNRDTLISGDPDLIYPGETLLLPPVG